MDTEPLLNGKRTFRIELHVTASSNSIITFSSAEERLAISALDVNQDCAPDSVVERAFTGQRVQVFLNDGTRTLTLDATILGSSVPVEFGALK